MKLDFEITAKQEKFIFSTVDELLFGGAAGGGKSYVQLIDALFYAQRYPRSKQLILRRTFPELEKSLIRVSRVMYPKDICKYNSSNHTYLFENESIIDFGYCDSENDVYKYQSAEYDVIRFDELTHFTEFMYTYLLSRIRGTLPCPRGAKSSTNPGNVGHSFVKSRFIDIGAPEKPHVIKVWDEYRKKYIESTRLFIPSKVWDNPFLMENDPDYISRLYQLPEAERKALLDGDWDSFEGQFFKEWNREIHTCEPFEIPSHWRRYTTMDYGLDMLAHYDVAVDEQGSVYIYREIYQSGLIVSDVVARIMALESEDDHGQYVTRFAPPDLWNTQSLTGKSTALLFGEHGMNLTRSNNDRVAGWLALKELMKPMIGVDGQPTAKLKIFSICRNLIRTLPQLQHDDKRPNDCAREPHELTHAPDALRYFTIGWTANAEPPREERVEWEEDQYEDYYRASPELRKRILKEWGNPF